MSDSVADAERVSEGAAGNRPHRDGRTHAPVQPEPPVDPQAYQGWRAEGPADGRADVLLPPHEHECPGEAAQLDGSPSVAPRLPYGRPVLVPDRRDGVTAVRGPGSHAPAARDCHGHGHPAEGPRPARSAPCRCRSTTRARSGRSSATSATTEPTSRATTSCSTATTTRSTLAGRRLHERYRVAGSRVHRRHPRKREPNSSVQQVLPAMRTLGKLEDMLKSAG